MRLRTVLRPLVPHFLKCIYQERAVARLAPEPDALACRPFVKPGDCVIDVGANIGAYTNLLSHWVGRDGCVHAYEPIPETFSYLRNNVRKLGMSNVIIHNAAVSSRHGISKMRVPSGNFYRANISPDGDQSVELVRLDDEFARIEGRVAFIKCDAEFHEPEVIEGAIELIRRDRPVWLIETWSHDVIKRMVEFGYHATKLEHDWLFHMENSFTARDH